MFMMQSCFTETFRDSSDTFVEFSTDTLAFDTVFTSLGSATRNLKVYNPYAQSIEIDRIYLEDKANGFFRLNIDGLEGNEHTNIEIPPRDSIYIFAEVTIDPNSPLTTSPFIIEDYLRVEVNGNEQAVLLSAWGQDANYIPNNSNKGGVALLSCDNATVTWDDPKPYVIYGILAIDSCELIIPAGKEIYVHGGVVVTEDGAYNDGVIVVQEMGKITVNGTVDEQVIFQGDRLEMEFDDVPGQWGGIIINDLSEGSKFTHTEIRNSVVGVRVDSLASASFSKVIFNNQAASGLIGFHSKDIYAENCLFYNSGGANVTLAFGGNYRLDYCTMASYDSGGSAIAASNFRCIEPTCLQGFLFNPIEIEMNNCILVGDEADEIIFDDRSIEEGDFTYQLNHCIVQVDELLDNIDFATFFDKCEECYNIQSMDTLFVDVNIDDYHLDTGSVAIERSIPIATLDIDLDGQIRDAINPDPGCYEFQE